MSEDGRSLRDGLSSASPIEPASPSRPEASIPSAGFASDWWEFLNRQSAWEDAFCELLYEGQDYHHLGTDDYDGSLEICEATNDWRLNDAQQRFLFEAGFAKAYVNHKDGWQTHYSLSDRPARGWRRRYVSDATAQTTNVIAGEPNPGYFEISYWPEGWNGPGFADWLASGYMRIVPDPLDPYAQAIEARRAATGTGAVHESAVAESDAPNPNPESPAQPLRVA